MTVSSNRLLARNAVIMYLRMLVTVVISLYSARVVINTLGLSDYGVYSVVSGFLLLFSFLNGSMAGSSTRFLSYAIGSNNITTLVKTFRACLVLHIFIALLIAFFAIIFGVWFLDNKLVIPSDRLVASHYVLYFSILSIQFQILQSPFNALVISHERFGFIAFTEILNALLKLLILYVLLLGNFDKLILYAALLSCVSIIICVVYCSYCLYNFDESRKNAEFDCKVIFSIINYTLWQFYGNMSLVAITHGVNMLLNMYFGPIMNAAFDIASKVSFVLLGVIYNINSVVNPQIIKSYSSSQHQRTLSLMQNSSKIAFLLTMFVCTPLIIECPFILKIWIGNVPEHTDTILRLFLLFNLIVSMSQAMGSVANATGDVKIAGFLSGTLYLSILPITYLSFMHGAPFWLPFLLNSIAVMFAPLYTGYVISSHIEIFSWKNNVFIDQIRQYFFMFIVILLVYIFSSNFEYSIKRFVFTVMLSSTIIPILGLYIVFSRENRVKIFSFVLHFFQDKR